jgi:hypothetical protein
LDRWLFPSYWWQSHPFVTRYCRYYFYCPFIGFIKIIIQKRITLWPKKIITSPPLDETQTVVDLVKKSNRILVSIRSHKFPFDFFPDVINVEEGRVTIITRDFFFSSHVHSVDIKDISNIFINMTPFFAQLVIVSMTFTENEIRIRNLLKEEAVFVRRIIEGLRIFKDKQIDTSSYSNEELIIKLKELSKTEIVF